MKKRFAMLMLTVGMTLCIGGCAIGHDTPLTDEQSTLYTENAEDEHGLEESKEQDEDVETEGGSTRINGDTADVDISGCFIVRTVGARDFDVTDFTDGVPTGEDSDLTINTYDLDDKALGEWVTVGGFEICHYSYFYYGTTSPENRYLIKVSDGCKVAVEGTCIYDIAYDGKQVITGNDYDPTHGYFLLSDDGTAEFTDWTFVIESLDNTIDFEPTIEKERGLPVGR